MKKRRASLTHSTIDNGPLGGAKQRETQNRLPAEEIETDPFGVPALKAYSKRASAPSDENKARTRWCSQFRQLRYGPFEDLSAMYVAGERFRAVATDDDD